MRCLVQPKMILTSTIYQSLKMKWQGHWKQPKGWTGTECTVIQISHNPKSDYEIMNTLLGFGNHIFETVHTVHLAIMYLYFPTSTHHFNISSPWHVSVQSAPSSGSCLLFIWYMGSFWGVSDWNMTLNTESHLIWSSGSTVLHVYPKGSTEQIARSYYYIQTPFAHRMDHSYHSIIKILYMYLDHS